MDSLDIKHSNPKNNKDDITIYGFNFPKILDFLNESTKRYALLGGLWFKENQFRTICKKANAKNSKSIVEGRAINKSIFKQIKSKHKIISYKDIKRFGRNDSQANKAIRCWKKNKLIKRIGWNKYKIL